jgi:hypothetical protein
MAVNTRLVAGGICWSVIFTVAWAVLVAQTVQQGRLDNGWLLNETCIVENATFLQQDGIYARVDWCITSPAYGYTQCVPYSDWSTAVDAQQAAWRALLPAQPETPPPPLPSPTPSDQNETVTWRRSIDHQHQAIACAYSTASPNTTLTTTLPPTVPSVRYASLVAFTVLCTVIGVVPGLCLLGYALYWACCLQAGHVRRDDAYRAYVGST